MEEYFIKFRSKVSTAFYYPETKRVSLKEAAEYINNIGIEVLDFGSTRIVLDGVDLSPLIDLALATNDREWFNKLTAAPNRVKVAT